jgi:hypothetical protein
MLLGLLAAIVALTGCTRPIDGSAQMASRDVDKAYFFAGEVPTYGQTVGPDDVTALAYLRAMRRIDPCGLLTRDAMSKIGEIGAVGTLYTLDECDIDIKMPGEANRRYASIEVTLTHTSGAPAAFRAGGVPVYEAYPGSCDYLMPLDLSRLPGAQPLRKTDQPFLRIGLISGENCELAQRLARAVAPRIESLQLPVRDAVAAYPAALAERDPCQVLAEVGADVDHWDITRSQPYECDFGVWRNGFRNVVPIQLSLEPQIFDIATENRTRRDRDGVELYVDETFCSAIAFVGAPMKRKLFGGDFVSNGSFVIRPTVVVDSGGAHCGAVADIAIAAAKLYS